MSHIITVTVIMTTSAKECVDLTGVTVIIISSAKSIDDLHHLCRIWWKLVNGFILDKERIVLFLFSWFFGTEYYYCLDIAYNSGIELLENLLVVCWIIFVMCIDV